MGAEIDRTRRATKVAAGAMAGLFLLVLFANLLWGIPPTTFESQPRMPPTASPFPVFNRTAATVHVVHMDASANTSTRLLLTSLQGSHKPSPTRYQKGILRPKSVSQRPATKRRSEHNRS